MRYAEGSQSFGGDLTPPAEVFAPEWDTETNKEVWDTESGAPVNSQDS
jgi:hypothetical protein